MHTALKYFSILLLFGLLATGCDDKKKESNGEGDADNGENTEQTDNGEGTDATDPGSDEPASGEAADVSAAAERLCKCLDTSATGDEVIACMEKIEDDFSERDFNGEFGDKVVAEAEGNCPELMDQMQ